MSGTCRQVRSRAAISSSGVNSPRRTAALEAWPEPVCAAPIGPFPRGFRAKPAVCVQAFTQPMRVFDVLSRNPIADPDSRADGPGQYHPSSLSYRRWKE